MATDRIKNITYQEYKAHIEKLASKKQRVEKLSKQVTALRNSYLKFQKLQQEAHAAYWKVNKEKDAEILELIELIPSQW